MDNLNGAERLISSILEDARAFASAYEAQAAADIETIRSELEEDRVKLRDEYARKAHFEKADIIKRAKTNAELDCRKELLERKHKVISAAYEEAEKRLYAMQGAEREALLARMLSRECSGGEIVRPAPADRAALLKLAVSCGVPGLTVGEDEPSIAGGFVLCGANFIKDCSFSALMEDVKQRTLGKVAGILFGGD